jgi:flagellar basal-body rod protein FlgF
LDSGYYATLTGLLARSQNLDAVASNLANAGTSGFRAERDFFRNAIVGPEAGDSELNSVVNNYGVLGGSMLDFGQGAIAATGNPLDIALQGSGFLAVQTAHGIRYTRDGRLVRAVDGTLVSAAGEPVLDANHHPIALPAGPVVIGADGTLSIDGAIAGRIGVFDFQDANALAPEGVGHYAPVPGAKASPASAYTVRQGALEGSNQDAIHGTMELIFVERQAEMMQKALTLFHNDFNKTATEDLPKA